MKEDLHSNEEKAQRNEFCSIHKLLQTGGQTMLKTHTVGKRYEIKRNYQNQRA